ncbi:hypothetical protein D8I24_2768 (plasmid) [Cupriavidus necator H850]|uniref:amidase n=1 Tax=Cupriavidus necator TaxID=106590 RepID=UPI00129EE29B|nr:amidase [Cupriavidus necator]KAI3603831.1 hypothetical protein D8I24_2768 [Cupriavidus necator H850]
MTHEVQVPELVKLTATELKAGLDAGEFDTRDVARQYLAHIDHVNPHLNAIVRLEREAWDDSVAHAGAALAGVPVSVKDNLWVEGRVATNGSRLHEGFRAPADAASVARLRAAGAALVGSTNCSEFACKGNTTNLVYGATRHPLDLSRTPGGSSGGAAAAVAAGLCAVALATDAGGSVRRPAAHAGVVGFKPTAGLIAQGPGFDEPVYGQGVIGLMGRSVRDVSLAFDRLHGYDAVDPQSVASSMIAVSVPGRRLRIAFSPQLGLGFAVDAGVAQVVEEAVQRLASAGHQVEYRDPPWPGPVKESDLMPLQLAGLAAIHGDALRSRPRDFDPDIGAQIDAGLSLPAIAVARALELRKQLYRALHNLFGQVDCLITPTTPCVAWAVERNGPETIGGKPASPRDHAVFTPLFNHTFLPACSVPCGLAEHSLPAGLQIVGPMYGDRTVLQLADELEVLLGAPFRRPRVVL